MGSAVIAYPYPGLPGFYAVRVVDSTGNVRGWCRPSVEQGEWPVAKLLILTEERRYRWQDQWYDVPEDVQGEPRDIALAMIERLMPVDERIWMEAVAVSPPTLLLARVEPARKGGTFLSYDAHRMFTLEAGAGQAAELARHCARIGLTPVWHADRVRDSAWGVKTKAQVIVREPVHIVKRAIDDLWSFEITIDGITHQCEWRRDSDAHKRSKRHVLHLYVDGEILL